MLDFARRLNVFSKIRYTKNRESVHIFQTYLTKKRRLKKDSIFMFFLVKVKQKFSDVSCNIHKFFPSSILLIRTASCKSQQGKNN